MTSTPAQLLEQQHRDIDSGILGILEGDGDTAALGKALRLLREHIYLEEEVLFPPLEEAGLQMPVFVMKREHGEMWPLIEVLEVALEADPPISTLKGRCRRLMQRLNVHNPKEEEVVYTSADKLPEAAELLAALENARMPEDWTCATAHKGPEQMNDAHWPR